MSSNGQSYHDYSLLPSDPQRRLLLNHSRPLLEIVQGFFTLFLYNYHLTFHDPYGFVLFACRTNTAPTTKARSHDFQLLYDFSLHTIEVPHTDGYFWYALALAKP